MNKRVLVIGATGLVGSRFVKLVEGNLDTLLPDKEQLDIVDIDSVRKYFDKYSFDTVINFASFSKVDTAEKERGDETGLTWQLNVDGVKNLLEACQLNSKFLVQISTDFVFQGDESNAGPYDEDATLPSSSDGLSWYGWTKNRAEHIIQSAESKHAIVRIAYPFYSSLYEQKIDFAKNYLNLFDDGKLFPIFIDQVFTPLYVDDLVRPLVKILVEEVSGTFHVVSRDNTTFFNFVEYLLQKARGATGVVQKGSMKDFLKIPGRTPRPRLGGLKTEKTQEMLGIKFRSWKEMINDFVENL